MHAQQTQTNEMEMMSFFGLHYRERFSSNFVDLAVLRLSYHCSTLYLLMIYRMFGVAEHVQLHRHFAVYKNTKIRELNKQNKNRIYFWEHNHDIDIDILMVW